jgi:hypothetical protein
MHKLLVTATLVAAFMFGSIAQAAIIPISGVTASSTFHSYDVNDVINGSGLSAGIHDGLFTNKWVTNGTSSGTLTFDLGSVFSVSSTSIWNYGGGCCDPARSVRDMTIEISTDNVSFTNVSALTLSQSLVSSIPAQLHAMNATGRYVRFNLLNNYGGSFVGLSEVQFDSALASAPEPLSSILLGFGLVALGVSRRRRSHA